MVKFDFDPLHTIIIYDEHLCRAVYFRQKGIWYKVEGTCDKCAMCCIKPTEDGYEKCKYLDSNNNCTVQEAKECALFPSGTPDQYFKELKEVLLTKCKLRIIKVGVE